jgi:hypothetical protein
MGTNYYLRRKDRSDYVLPVDPTLILKALVEGRKQGLNLATDECTETTKELHIGKKSGGWCFSLCIYPFYDIYDLEDWKKRFNSGEEEIYDECDRLITPEEMLEIIAPKTSQKSLHHKSEFIDLRKQERFKGFLPILSLTLPGGKTYDLSLDWSFS